MEDASIHFEFEGKEQTTEPPRLSMFAKKWWVDNRERLAEWYRLYFHTITVTFLMVINLWLGYSSFLLYFAQWFNVESGPIGFLSIFFEDINPKGPLANLVGLFYIPLHHNMTLWILLVLNLPLFNWLYSTATQPIMKGYSTIISWTSKRGRVAAAILSGIPFICTFTAIFAWYVRHYLFDYFASVKSAKEYLVVKSMESFGYVLMVLPVFISVFSIYVIVKEYYRNEDLQKMFYKWVFPLLARQSYTLRGRTCDVIVGWEKETNKPIVLSENSRFLHELIVGATGTGKTSTAILIRIVQDLIRIARGRKLGVVVLEPKGDLIRDVLNLCEDLGIPDHMIKVVDPTNIVRSTKFNPFIGPMESAAETYRGVLDALAGNQNEFFKGQQGETASAYTMLGKILYGNSFSIYHMQKMYGDPRYLADIAEVVREKINEELSNPALDNEKKNIIDRYDRVVSYFENEVLEYKTYREKDGSIVPVLYRSGHTHEGKQVVENKKDQFITGGKKYLNDIVMNAMLSQLMVANDGEEALDIDKFLDEGGVLLVNTALGELEELSLSFGQFFIRQFQSSVFRRPPEVKGGYKRCPIFFSIDEFPLYINSAFIRLLTIGRGYKVGTLIAIQSLGQLEVVMPGYDKTVMNSARNKTVFGGGEFEDNEKFSKAFGEEYQVEESMNESTTPVSMPNQSWGKRYNTQRKLAPRFTETDIKEQEFKHFIVDLVDSDGSVRAPIRSYGKFITETKFIKKFVNIGKIEFETKNHKPLSIAAHKIAHFNLLKPLVGNDTKERDEQDQEDIQIETIQTEMLPTTPVQDEEELPMEVTSSSQSTDESTENSVETKVNSEHNQNYTLNSSSINESRLYPVDDDDEPESPLQVSSNEQKLTLTQEEDESYTFFSDSSNSKYSAEGSNFIGSNHIELHEIDDETTLQTHENDSTVDSSLSNDLTKLPSQMEASLTDLFKNLDNTIEVSQEKLPSDEESSGASNTDEGETKGNAQQISNVEPATILRSQPFDSHAEDFQSQNTEQLGLDKELFDLVAEDKRAKVSVQQEIATSRITSLNYTEVDDD